MTRLPSPSCGFAAEADCATRSRYLKVWRRRCVRHRIAGLGVDGDECSNANTIPLFHWPGLQLRRIPWFIGTGHPFFPDGRDHNHWGYSMWMAGGGVKGGHIHGATDEFGFAAIENRMHVHDLHATMLHLMGLDHES